MKIINVHIENIRSFKHDKTFNLNKGLNLLVGPNGGGKSILLEVLNNFSLLLIPKYEFNSQNGIRINRSNINSTNLNRVFTSNYHNPQGNKKLEIEVLLTEQDKVLITKCIEYIDRIYEDLDIVVSTKDGMEMVKSQLIDPFKNNCEYLLNEDFDQPFNIKINFDNSIYLSRAASERELVLMDFLERYEYFRKILWFYKISKGSVDNFSLPELLEYISPNRNFGYLNQVKINMDNLQQTLTSNRLNQIHQNYTSQSVQDNSIDYFGPFVNDVCEAIYRGLNTFDPPIRMEKSLTQHEHFQRFNHLLFKYLHMSMIIEKVRMEPLFYKIKFIKDDEEMDMQYISSGQRQMIYHIAALSDPLLVGGTLIIDEPELHLHPQLQKKLLKLILESTIDNNIQVITATHSELFMNEETFDSLSRVYVQDDSSTLVQANENKLSNFRDIVQIINASNNEKIFFSDEVVLVEGDIDRIILSPIIDHLIQEYSLDKTLEVVAVQGKQNFPKYRQFLDSMGIPNSIITDFDFSYSDGPIEIKQIFEIDRKEIAEKVKDGLNDKSKDGKWLVESLKNAIETQSSEDLKECWKYMESRYRQVKTQYTDAEKDTLKSYIDFKASEKVYILRKNGLGGLKGDIESYLPSDYQTKNFNKIIPWTKSENYYSNFIAGNNADEIIEILKHILNL